MNRFFIFAASLIVACGANGQSTADEDLVKQFFPERLTTQSASIEARGGPKPVQHWTYRLADLDGSGKTDFLAAAYTNGFSGAVRIIRKTASGGTLVADPQLDIHGVQPDLELEDLDGDLRPEIIASFSSPNGGTAKWVFKWTGATLTFLGPSIVVRGKEQTALGNAAFEDLDGDGISEILDPPATGEMSEDGSKTAPDTATVYSLRNGKYVKTADLNFFATFVRAAGKPALQHDEFSISQTNRTYELHIDNGSKRAKAAVDSAIVKLNGVVIADERQFSENTTEIVVRPLSLQSTNTLDVLLRGNPGSRLTILVQPLSSPTASAH
jgi:hypothetical protein